MFYQENNALMWRYGDENLRIEPWGRDALRVRATLTAWPADQDWALLPREETGCEICIDEAGASIRNGRMTAFIDRHGRLTFKNAEGKTLLREYREPKEFPEIRGREWRPILNGNFELTVRFDANDGEMIYGMGEYQQPLLNLKGAVLDLAQRNTQASIPFYISSHGYGFLWNNPAVGDVSFSTNITRWHARETCAVDYWICAGDSPREILHTYADATGKPPMLPDYAMDLIQSKLRYLTQEELLEVAREYHRRGLKLGTIVIDFFHWSADGSYYFDRKYWPDPDAMVRELEQLGVRVMASFWPNMGKESPHYAEFAEKGLFITVNHGIHNYKFVDMTNPEARELVWKKHRPEYFDRGIQNFFVDASEPEICAGISEVPSYMAENLRYKLGNGNAVGNIYPFYDAKLFYDALTAEGIAEPFNIIRCAWAGSQRFGCMLWSGDVKSSFEAFRDQVCVALSVGLAGHPWFTTDTGGFYGGNVTTDSFKELLCRWYQFSVFSPVLRMHGVRKPAFMTKDGLYSGAANELWSYGDEVYRILTKFLDVRAAIKPYLRSVMEEAHLHGDPAIRAMFYEFPEDPVCWNLKEQYMLGSDLLVAPVLYEGAQSAKVYLPAGVRWTDAWTGETLDGGQWIERAAPLDLIPIYVRDGAEVLKSFEAFR